MQALPVVRATLAGLCLLPGLVFAAPLDRFWPQVRHDAQRTSHVAAQGKVDAPAVRWRYFLGGNLGAAKAWDVDLDGRDDVLAVEGGRATARSWHGKLLWSTPALGAIAIARIADLDGDGLAEVVVQSSNAAHVVASVTGQVVWSSPAGLFPGLGFIGVADFDGDGLADLALASAAGAGLSVYPTTHFYRFASKAALPGVLVVTEFAKTPLPSPGIEAYASTGQAVVDVDGDGVADLFLPGVHHFYAFSGKTGALLASSASLDAVSAGGAALARVAAPDGGTPLLVYSGDDESGPVYHLRGMYVMRRAGADLKVLWNFDSADTQADRFRLMPGAVGDVDGDGKLEVLAGHFTGGKWALEARDLLTGQLLSSADATAPWLAQTGADGGGPLPIRALRLGQAGPLVLQCTLAKTANPQPFAALRLITWTRDKGFAQLADLGSGVLVPATLAPPATDEASWQPGLALSLGKPEVGATELAVARDLDGDNRADRLDLLRIATTGQVTTAHQLLMSSPLHALAVFRDADGTRNLALAGQDGRVAVLDPTLTLRNDADADKQPDLRYGGLQTGAMTVAPVHDKDPAPLLLAGAGDQLLVLDPALAGPVTPPVVRWSFRSGAWQPRGSLADLDGDGAREILVRHQPVLQGATLTAFSPLGKPLWSHVQPDGPWAWGATDGDAFAVADIDGDGADDAVCSFDLLGPVVNDKPYLSVISGKTGKDLWPAKAPCAAGYVSFAVDTSVKPAQLDISAYTQRILCDAVAGTMISLVKGKTITYGVPMLLDLDGDGQRDHVLGGAGFGMAAEVAGPGYKSLWQQTDPDVYHASATVLPSGKDLLVASASNVQPAITTRDARTGKTMWKRLYVGGKALAPEAAPASALATHGLVSVADLTGKGHASLLFRTTEGWLYAVSAVDGSVDWALDWGGSFGDPVVADIDGDGLVEVVVAFSDGYVYALDHTLLAAVAWVRDNDGTGLALTDAQDIDQQEDTVSLHVNWAAEPGAQGYLVEVLDGNAAVVHPQQDVSLATAVDVTGLSLQPGATYRTVVRGYTNVGQDKATSVVAMSDGVTIVDASPPWLDGPQAKPMAFGPAGSTVITATLHDKTRLSGWKLSISAAGVATPVWTAAGVLAGPKFIFEQTWKGVDLAGLAVAPGEYVATVTATDTAGHQAQGSVTVQLCAGTPGSTESCTPKQPGADVTGGGKVRSIDGSHPSDCAASRSGGVWPCFALLGLVLLATRRRFHKVPGHR